MLKQEMNKIIMTIIITTTRGEVKVDFVSVVWIKQTQCLGIIHVIWFCSEHN